MLEDFEQEWKRQMHGSLGVGWKEQMLEAYRQGDVERTIIASGGDVIDTFFFGNCQEKLLDPLISFFRHFVTHVFTQ